MDVGLLIALVVELAELALWVGVFCLGGWAQLPYELLARVSGRIVNEVDGVNGMVYDISSKPPPIEWE